MEVRLALRLGIRIDHLSIIDVTVKEGTLQL